MPCNTYQGNDPEFHERYGTNDPDKLADMLCRTLNIVFDNCQYVDVDNPIPADIRDWWLKHKKWDEERKKK